MAGDSDPITATVRPALAGTAFAGARAQGGSRPDGAASLLWCTPTAELRRRHPGVTAAVDVEHPDGCTDLTVEVDGDGRLVRADLELLEIAPDLVGTPAPAALPLVADRLRSLLRPADR